MSLLLFIAGLVFLIAGAELLVRGASRLAEAAGISTLVVGLTVVAFGTSSPELAVSIDASLSGQANIALGNVVGSNIFNVLFILGTSALIVPLVASRQLIRFDVPVMILVSAAVWLLSLNGILSRWDGILLFGGLIAYLAFLIFQSRKEKKQHSVEFGGNAARGALEAEMNDLERGAGPFGEPALPDTESTSSRSAHLTGTGAAGSQNGGGQTWRMHLLNILFVVVGLALLVWGSRWLVSSAVTLAGYLGISELVVGLTIVAAGTSMPEVVTSIVAAIKGERDIAVGNVVGSNIFNILGVLGLSSIVAPAGITISPAVAGLDLPIMILVALACLPIFFTGGQISRLEGVLLLAYYIAYTAFLILAASKHDALPFFSGVMIYLALPITAIALVFIAIQQMRLRRNR